MAFFDKRETPLFFFSRGNPVDGRGAGGLHAKDRRILPIHQQVRKPHCGSGDTNDAVTPGDLEYSLAGLLRNIGEEETFLKKKRQGWPLYFFPF